MSSQQTLITANKIKPITDKLTLPELNDLITLIEGNTNLSILTGVTYRDKVTSLFNSSGDLIHPNTLQALQTLKYVRELS